MSTLADKQRFTKAVVAVYLTNGLEPVDGANEPREFVGGCYEDAAELARELVEDGILDYAGDNDRLMVEPTARGMFVALS